MTSPPEPNRESNALEYANADTPMLSSPFPSPQLTAWVMLGFTLFWATAGISGVVWIIVTVNDSPEPFGAFACMLVPIGLIGVVLIGLIIETVRSFRRASALQDENKQRESVKRSMSDAC